MKIKANLEYKPGNFQMDDCQIEKVVELSAREFAALTLQPLRDRDFIAENKDFMFSENGVLHCLLALGEGNRDGVLIESEGYDYPRYAAYVPGMRDIVNAELERAAEFIARQGIENTGSGNWCVHAEELEERLGLTVREGSGFDVMLKAALEHRPEVAAVSMEGNYIEVEYCPEFCPQLQESPVEETAGIRVLQVAPGEAPKSITIPNTLAALQTAVGGCIEVLSLDCGGCLICNEEGKLMGLPANRQVGDDIIAGTFLIVGEGDDEFCSLSDKNVAHYAEQFAEPVPSDGPIEWGFHMS